LTDPFPTPGRVPGAQATGCGFALVPIGLLVWIALEVYTLGAVADRIGALRTLGLFVATTACGVLFVRRAGLNAARDLMGWGQSMSPETLRAAASGGAPAAPLPLAGSAPRLFGGLLLIMPGFVSDALGVLCLVPPLRFVITARARGMLARAAQGAGPVWPRGFGGRREGADPGASPFVVEGEVVSSRPVDGTGENDHAEAHGALPPPGPDS
jgi:UPF0716 protein FxsA